LGKLTAADAGVKVVNAIKLCRLLNESGQPTLTDRVQQFFDDLVNVRTAQRNPGNEAGHTSRGDVETSKVGQSNHVPSIVAGPYVRAESEPLG
jgi:hypothetical protein